MCAGGRKGDGIVYGRTDKRKCGKRENGKMGNRNRVEERRACLKHIYYW